MSSSNKQAYEAEIEYRLDGIPCLIGVTFYQPYVPAYTCGLPENCYPAEGGYGDYDILDRRGYQAAWLERKVDAQEEESIQQAIFDYMEN